VAVIEATIFDIDGTLIDSFEAASNLYIAAVEKVLSIANVNSDFSTYRHVTDQGVMREIMQVNGITPDPKFFEAAKLEFISLLMSHIHKHGPFKEIPGAVAYVSRLTASDEHYVAYATGAWRESAIVKLESAGFPTYGVPISTSSDFEDRVSIMRGAMTGAPPGIERITYYGDAVWDRAAVQELGWEFVPVGKALGGIQHYYGTAT
jgi:beta-phosphoglucomutase-like phosphatase (HAD superfamily)